VVIFRKMGIIGVSLAPATALLAGRVFLIGGRRALAAAKQAAEQAQEAAKGERGRLVIGSVGPATISFLPVVLSRFREQHPLVEITVLHLNSRAQVEAVLNGSIMLGIGYLSSALEEDEQEQVSVQLLLRSPAVIVCPKNRRSPKRTVPKLKDFRHDKFLSLDPAYGFGYEELLRAVCKRLGGFEPDRVCVQVIVYREQRDRVRKADQPNRPGVIEIPAFPVPRMPAPRQAIL